MSSRHRRMIYSSSDDDDDNDSDNNHPQQPQHDDTTNDIVFEDADHDEQQDIESSIPNISTVTLTSSTTTTTTTAAAIEISDDDFIDVAENLSPPSPPPPPPPQQPHSPPVASVAAETLTPSDCPVNDELRKLGLYLRREWLNSCQLGLHNSVPGFENFDLETKAKLCFGQFLISDMNFIGAGVLPENICGLHLVDLAGPFVLQVDEVVNISCPLKERYKNAAPGLKRCLKLAMTDGVQRVFGMEYRPINSLSALSPAGFKVVIRNVNVRHGLLMLVPEVLEILGGSVEELEAARQRTVHEINKPPRGKRTRNGAVPPLSNRATQAAWPQNGVGDHNVPDNVANPVVPPLSHRTTHAAVPPLSNRATHAACPQNGAGDHSVPHNLANPVARNITNSVIRSSAQPRVDIQVTDTLSRSVQAIPIGGETAELSGMEGTNQHSISRESGHESVRRESDQFSVNRESGQQSISSEAAQNPTPREISPHSSVAEAHDLPVRREATEPPSDEESIMLNSVSTAAVEDEDAPMADYKDNPFILRGEREFPFSYMASVLTEWGEVQDNEPSVSSVKGKVKCILTGVKGFQYRNLPKFELLVFIDDGSLITDVLIHHNVVQSKIGYSPQAITAIFTSSDTVAIESMKKTLLQFQTFLLTFEGTMLVEMSKISRHPVVLEMDQSCLDVDAWQLLRRVKSA